MYKAIIISLACFSFVLFPNKSYAGSLPDRHLEEMRQMLMNNKPIPKPKTAVHRQISHSAPKKNRPSLSPKEREYRRQEQICQSFKKVFGHAGDCDVEKHTNKIIWFKPVEEDFDEMEPTTKNEKVLTPEVKKEQEEDPSHGFDYYFEPSHYTTPDQ